jgi:hypothetical protein
VSNDVSGMSKALKAREDYFARELEKNLQVEIKKLDYFADLLVEANKYPSAVLPFEVYKSNVEEVKKAEKLFYRKLKEAVRLGMVTDDNR